MDHELVFKNKGNPNPEDRGAVEKQLLFRDLFKQRGRIPATKPLIIHPEEDLELDAEDEDERSCNELDDSIKFDNSKVDFT